MKNKKYILALDQGTTSSRALLIDKQGNITTIAQKEFNQIFPKPGWVEHNPEEIWQTQFNVTQKVLSQANVSSDLIAGIGITNQRETTIVWDRESGEPVNNAIVWQDRRTSEYCDELRQKGYQEIIQRKTGLLPDAYFSATKIKWILENVPGAREKANKGELAFGTVDSWLIWKLTNGKVHATDVTNASRTMLFNITKLTWDEDLLEIFHIPKSILPDVKGCSEVFGETKLLGTAIPICGVAGDQQAALFGQMCIKKGMLKNSYGTGCFIVMNTGEKPIFSKNNLLSTVAWVVDKKPTYALEGSIFIAGAVVQWLRDGLKIIRDSKQVERLAKKVPDNGGVFFVPAFTGLGAPHWDQYARGTIIGITRGTTESHIARAALESIACQTKDVLDAMTADSQITIRELRVDGGASANHLLMQFQADILNINVVRPKILETTAMGAGFFAGLASGFWRNLEEIQALWQKDKEFKPAMNKTVVSKLLANWEKAVNRSKQWSNE